MAHPKRIVVPNAAHHITQRGNARRTVFSGRGDYFYYLRCLKEKLEEQKVALLAFCLMPNHIHLVLIPPDKRALSESIGRAHLIYARGLNRRQESSGHVWQGRFFSCPLDEAHLYSAVRYVEMNPVRAGLCASPYQYEWSSAAVHGGLCESAPVVDLASLGVAWKGMNWSAYLNANEAEAERTEIRACTTRGKIWSNPTPSAATPSSVPGTSLVPDPVPGTSQLPGVSGELQGD